MSYKTETKAWLLFWLEDVKWASDRKTLLVLRKDLEQAKATVREYADPSVHIIYNIVD